MGRFRDARRVDGKVVAPFAKEDVDGAGSGAADVEVDALFSYEAAHRIHDEPAFTDVVTRFESVGADSVNVVTDYAGDDRRFRSVGHLEQDVDSLFTEVEAGFLNVVAVELHPGSLYAREAADDGAVEGAEIPVATDNLFVDMNDLPVEADKTKEVTDESRVVTDRTLVDVNDAPVAVDILSVARADAGEETNKTDVATNDTRVGTDKTDVATHIVPVVMDSIEEGTAKIRVETTRLRPVTAPFGSRRRRFA